MKRRTVRLDKVETVVLDEADRMLDMGLSGRHPHSGRHAQPEKPGLFSATISREVMDISWVYQRDRLRSRFAPTRRTGQTSGSIYGRGRKRQGGRHGQAAQLGGYERVIAFCNQRT